MPQGRLLTRSPSLVDRLLDPQQAADLLGLRKATLYAWSYKRKIPSIRIGNRLRFRQSDLERLVRAGLRPALRPLREASPAEGDGGAA